MTNEEKIKILEDSILFRQNDIEERQIDIDNYIVSLEILDIEYSDISDVVAYRSHLEELLRTSVLEQTKVKIFLAAAKVNLEKLRN